MTRKRLAAGLIVLLCLLLIAASGVALARGRNSNSSSANVQHLWSTQVQPNVDSAPAFRAAVTTPHGKKALVYALAGNNGDNCSPDNPVRRATLYALDASNGHVIWTASTSGPARCTTAGPVVDPNGKWVYAPGLDGKIHAYALGTGHERRSGGWPKPYTLMPADEKSSATPTIASGYLYATTSGYIGDAGHYEGHLVAINLHTGRSNVFNSLCSNVRHLLTPAGCSTVQSGLFGRGQGAVDPVNHSVYIVSGNGPWNGSTNWGDSILKLSPSGSRLLDSYTPRNQQELNANDADLGSTGPALLPPIKAKGKIWHLLVQAGKGPACSTCNGAALRLLNRDNLSGHGGTGHLGGELAEGVAPGGGEVLTAPAVWKGPGNSAWDFVANGAGVAAYRVDVKSGGFMLHPVWQSSSGGTTPVLHRGTLYVASGGDLRGLDPATGRVLWHTSQIADVHWQYPLVAGGRVFIADQSGHVQAFRIHG